MAKIVSTNFNFLGSKINRCKKFFPSLYLSLLALYLNEFFLLFFADTLGTEGGSSWASETTSPGSSCATPNSAVTEAPESELSFTVGATDVTPHSCRFCEKAFPRQSYLKKHEQVSTYTYTPVPVRVILCHFSPCTCTFSTLQFATHPPPIVT